MASTFAPYSLLHGHGQKLVTREQSKRIRWRVLAVASETPPGEGKRRQKGPPGVDTRIHWENEEEGWVGGGNSQKRLNPEEELLGSKFSDLLNDSNDSHYQ